MATTRIESLIEDRDSFEILRDEIAAIIAVESAKQQALALAQGKDPNQWTLRVYTERATPWAVFPEVASDLSVPPEEFTPVVNVRFDVANYERSSTTVLKQTTTGTFHVDCYGYGVATDEGSTHRAGDEQAALEAHRAYRLARKILMAPHWHKLGQPALVWGRWVASGQVFEAQRDNTQAQHVIGVRLALDVTFNELSPQHEPVELELISTTVSRDGDGKILVTVDIPTPPPTP